MGDLVLALCIVGGFAVVVAELRNFAKRQLRLQKDTVRLARQQLADEFNRVCYPHLYLTSTVSCERGTGRIHILRATQLAMSRHNCSKQ